MVTTKCIEEKLREDAVNKMHCIIVCDELSLCFRPAGKHFGLSYTIPHSWGTDDQCARAKERRLLSGLV